MVKPPEDEREHIARCGVANPFSVLGLPERFDLSPALIESSWLRAAAKAHPDRVGSDGPGDGAGVGGAAESLRTIAAVNAAHATVSDAAQRGEALLVLKGGSARERDNALPEGFLMDIFEVRQEMEEAVASGRRERIEPFEAWARAQRDLYIARVSAQFAAMGEPATRAQLDEVRRTLNAWRYIERMIEQVPD